jgi:halimadienyl-diphosphate synthase
MPNWYEELVALFKDRIGKGAMAGTAYDTAWVASIPDPERPDRPAFPQALEWLRLHQHSDGSWGTDIEYYHDRVLSTLIACIVLAEWRADDWTEYQIEAGLRSIWRNVTNLKRDPCMPIGFELILPTLLGRAKALNFQLPYPCFSDYEEEQKRKLAKLPPELIYSRYVSSTFSFEFLGDHFDASRLDHDAVQEANGSVAASPSATSYFVRKTGAPSAMEYIRKVVTEAHGAVPTVAPIDIVELGWSLYNLYLVNECYPPEAAPCHRQLEHLWSSRGVAYSRFFSAPDLDDTAVAFAALSRAGRQPDPAVFASFEKDDHFQCFPYERDPSVSVHVHLLDALSVCADFPEKPRMVRKAIDFLRRTQVYGAFWFDKWHTSPYYTTTHAINVALDIAPDLVGDGIAWLVQTQRPDGSWGALKGTAEETAYALQALVAYQRRGGKVRPATLQQGAVFLEQSVERRNVGYPLLWVSKTLYSPKWVVHSAVLGAMVMVQAALNG